MRKGFGLVGSLTEVLEVLHIPTRMKTYNRLEKNSMVFTMANDIITIKHTVVKSLFFHKELGISAGFCARSCLRCQKMKMGIRRRLSTVMTITPGWRILDRESVNVLFLSVSYLSSRLER